MAGSERASLSIVRVVLVMAFYGCCNGNLQLTLDRSWDKDYCGYLHCWYQDNSDKDISIISDISLYDITRPDFRKQIATVKNDGLGIKINPSSINNVTGNGSIVDLNASLSVSFWSPQDCQLSSFLCELGCVNINNQRETIGVENRARPSDQCDCGAVNSQLFAASTQLSALRQDNKNLSTELSGLRQDNTALSTELSAIRIQYSFLLLQLQNLSSQVLPTQHYLTSVLTFPSTSVTTTSPATTRITTSALGSKCSRGMSHSSPRVKFLLWGKTPALCDTETDGGGWVIIQRRTKGDVDFYRDWQSYKTGFGTPDTDFWVGNDVIHNLTTLGYSELRVDIIFYNTQFYAQYDVFAVDNEDQNYRLTVSGYRGTAGDGLAYHNNSMFSTYDRDNDKVFYNCATDHHGAWWYNRCYESNLNGVWGFNDHTGIIWEELSGSTSFTEIKVRL